MTELEKLKLDNLSKQILLEQLTAILKEAIPAMGLKLIIDKLVRYSSVFQPDTNFQQVKYIKADHRDFWNNLKSL